uniref:Uncharacterized protein n=1 Tax=viral metagenome TaxID=1070528 RepID=A0A6M3Y2I7_9ZZZZ
MSNAQLQAVDQLIENVMQRIEFHEIFKQIICLSWAINLVEFSDDVLAAYIPGWERELTEEGVVEAIDVLASAIFGVD